nr:response regulator [Gemmatimonadota bacterium]
ILSKLLADNKDGNLTDKQVEFAQTILSSGTDLLNLINDVLDLSKVEAGKMEIDAIDVRLSEIRDFVDRSFGPVAEQKGLKLAIEIAPELPAVVHTDGQRMQQVLKNLLSNAFKFTSRGGVTLRIERPAPGTRFGHPALNAAPNVVAFAVQDTGIGIAGEKQKLIFEAFQQEDGTTSRKFGGTGLGLSISREIAHLLGGEIQVQSQQGEGSTFALFLPESYAGRDQERRDPNQPTRRVAQKRFTGPDRRNPYRSTRRDVAGPGGSAAPAVHRSPERAQPASYVPPVRSATPLPNPLKDDRDAIELGDRTVLVIENDENFARTLLEMARQKDFRGIVALDGETGLEMVHHYGPDAVTLDIDLPGIDGWEVLERLKGHPETRHIPVHIVSGVDTRQRGLTSGAISYLEKPVSKEAIDDAFDRIGDFLAQGVKRLLVVEDDQAQRQSIVELVGHDDVEITAVATAEEALRELESKQYDCMVLDLGLADMNGFNLLETVKENEVWRDLPIIVYTGKDLSPADDTKLRRYAETIIIKDASSPERLLDETALFLHRVEAELPEQKRRMLEQLHNSDDVFRGKQVLIVDDDVRNIFSLTSVLEERGMTVRFAENGRDGIEALQQHPDTDMVLMDVMMPEMDGYETMRAIREIPEFKSLPIISLTAKAMKGDREKSIAAGASDYITKPVDTDQLLSLMRVWLYR